MHEQTRDARLTFSILWIFVLFNYVYADFGTLFTIMMRPALMTRLQGGSFGSGPLTQYFFLGAAVLMELCIVMVLLSWVLGHKANRRTNIAAGIFFTAVILLTLFGARRMPPPDFYTFFQVIEIVSTAAIAWRAWRWRVPAREAAA